MDRVAERVRKSGGSGPRRRHMCGEAMGFECTWAICLQSLSDNLPSTTYETPSFPSFLQLQHMGGNCTRHIDCCLLQATDAKTRLSLWRLTSKFLALLRISEGHSFEREREREILASCDGVIWIGMIMGMVDNGFESSCHNFFESCTHFLWKISSSSLALICGKRGFKLMSWVFVRIGVVFLRGE